MQFKDLKSQYEALKDEIDAGISSVIDSSSFILGKEVGELESKLAGYVGRRYCVTCASGSDALMLSLMALDIGPGDAVFVPDFTFVASANAVAMVGATPVFTDIRPDTFTMDPRSLENAIKEVSSEGRLTPKAVIPVDLFGLPADYDSIYPVADKYGLYIVEDGAQGFGGSIRGKRACSFGDISATSFFPSKPLGCYGDGGALFTDDSEIFAILKSLRAQGRSPDDKYDSKRCGINSRLDTLQAAILLPKLEAFERYEVDDIGKIAEQYTDKLSLKLLTPTVPEGYLSSWAQYTVLFPDSSARDGMKAKLQKEGIPSMIYYPRGLHHMAAFQSEKYQDDKFPNTCNVANRCLSLPINPYMQKEEVERVCDVLLKEES